VFAILNVEYKKTIGILNVFRRQKIKIERVDFDSFHYYVINLKNARQGRINWRKVAWAAGREQSSLIIPNDINLPENCPCKPFDDAPFMRHIFLSTVLNIIKSANIRPASLTIGIVDAEAVAPDAAILALNLAAAVKVVTANTERYEHYSNQAMAATGAPLIISETYNTLNSCDIIIAPFGFTKNVTVDLQKTIFDETGKSGFKILKEDIILPKDFASKIPQKISHSAIAAALMERGRVPFAVNMAVKYFYINNIKLSAADVKAHIKSRNNT